MDHRAHYLKRYGEPEVKLLEDIPDASWDHALLIPAYDESIAFINRLLENQLCHNRVLLILVVNQPDMATPHITNDALIAYVGRSGHPIWQKGPLSLISLPNNGSAILLVDRSSSHRIPASQGVGLARKIAADIAVWLGLNGLITSPLLFCTDADSLLPRDYFDIPAPSASTAAYVCNFHHRCDDTSLGLATHLYERSLHHYVNGLRAANSPYAFHTIGSALVISATHYAMVRGFPKRAGGEDFYLLNKLAKTGSVVSLKSPVINIFPRLSQRVPFGTGPAVDRILAMKDPEEEFRVYNPAIFEELRQWLLTIPLLRDNDAALTRLSTPVRTALETLGLEKALEHSRRHSKDEKGYTRQMHTWFDGFKTLKFIHLLQSSAYPPVSIASVAPISQSM